MQSQSVYVVFYVASQERSARYYGAVFQCDPAVDKPGITEFLVRDDTYLALLTFDGAVKLHGERFPRTASGAIEPSTRPNAELYLVVDDPAAYHQRALAAGAIELSSMQLRGWGHRAAYSMDPDGNVIGFAQVERGESGAGGGS